jgi:hypothetical protein
MISDNITSLKQDTVQVKTGVLDLRKTQEGQNNLWACSCQDTD